MPVPVVCFVGRSNSGKTTFIERVIPELVRAGYKVATVKHAGHGFDLDTEGKDSWRHKQAGSATTIITSPRQIGMVMDVDHDHHPFELLPFLAHRVHWQVYDFSKKYTRLQCQIKEAEKPSQ